jgi:hypothetical protein
VNILNRAHCGDLPCCCERSHVFLNRISEPYFVYTSPCRWDAVHLKKTEKVPFSKENPGARAALLSGPPGIGKSTVAA